MKLVCFPCPNNSMCCQHGVDIYPDEEVQIILNHGAEAVVSGPNGMARTAVVDGTCIFMKENRCKIHAESYYPKVCKSFPFKDSESDEPYKGEVDCPSWKEES